MKRLATTAASAVVFSASAALAGGLDRSGQGIDVLFEPGTTLTTSFSYVMPTVSATNEALTGNIADPYFSFSAGYKQALTDQIDVALIYDQPYGADISYKGALTGMADAALDSHAVTALLRYKFNENISVHAGLRAQKVAADVSLPPIGGYVLAMESNWGFGYLVGAAYERPDIALRAALTYNSAITQTMTGTEGMGGGVPTSFQQDTPQSLNFDFQTGVAPGTLVFGSVRWVDWSNFTIAPPGYPANPMVSYGSDTFSYELGVGHRFTEAFSASVMLGYEAAVGGVASDLGPTDGYWSAAIGGSYQLNDTTKLSGGLRYVGLGDANGGALTGGAAFTGNRAIGFGMSLSTRF